MKDKVQKILSEIATRKLCTMDEHMAFYNDTAKEDYRFLSEIEELIKALQEEPVSEDLEETIDNYLKSYWGGEKEKQDWPFLKKMVIYFTKWQEAKDQQVLNEEGVVVLPEEAFERMKRSLIELAEKEQQMMAKAVDGVITFDYYGDDDKTYGCIAHDSFCLEDFGLKDRDKVKMILIKED